MDTLIALVIFIVGMIVFLYLVMGNSAKDSGDRLATESDVVPQRLIASDKASATNTSIVIDNKVDTEVLNKTLSKPYEELKGEMGVSNDFCIHFEDENGNLIDLDDDPCRLTYSIGNPNLNLTISDQFGERTIKCGETEYIC